MLAAIFASHTICTLDTQISSLSSINKQEENRMQKVMTTAWCPESRVTQVPCCSCA